MNIGGFQYKIFGKYLLLLLLTVVYSVSASFAETSDTHSDGKAAEKFNPEEVIMHHIGDAHEWHYATIGHTHYTFPLPVILYSSDRGIEIFSSSRFHHAEGMQMVEANETAENAAQQGETDSANIKTSGTEHNAAHTYNGYYLDDHGHIVSADKDRSFTDLSITKNVAALLLSSLLLLGIFFTIAGRYKNIDRAPSGIQGFFEPIILFVRDDIAKPNIGPKFAKYMPYLLTVFFFIWVNNMLGLLPGGANLTGNIAVTFVLAFVTFVITTFSGNKGYWMHIINTPGVPWWLKYGIPIVPVVEVIGIFTKPFSLMVRLFANITAGHIIILSLLSLTFLFESITIGVIASVFSTAMMVLELFVALLQAYVFTLLSAMYFGGAVAEHHHEHAEGHAEAHAH